MKDLELKDIIQRQRPRLTKLSVYQNGKWVFATVQGATSIADSNQNIYRGRTRFALIESNVNNPEKGSLYGQPGDYIGVDSTGELSLITQESYKQRFPKRISPRRGADSSQKLKNPDYITEIVRGSQPAPSNSRPTTSTPPPTSAGSRGTSGGSSGGGGGGY
jgi:hypothetical protein